MNFEEKINYQELSREIWCDNDIQSALKEGYELVKWVKQSNPELWEKFEREYEDLFNSIKEAWDNDKRISQEERARIMFELWDVINLADEEGIDEARGILSYIWDICKETDTSRAKSQALELREKNIDDYTDDEIIAAMNYLSHNYSNYKEISMNSQLTRWITEYVGGYSSIDELDNKYEVRLFQDELKQRIFWNNKEFNDKYLLWFNNERWNYVVSIKEFETELKTKDIKDINSKALSNYFLYLDSKNELNLSALIYKFWPNSLARLNEIWAENDDNDDKKQIAKDALKEKWIFDAIQGILSIFSNPDKLLEFLSKEIDLNEESMSQMQIWVEFFLNNKSALFENMQKALLEILREKNPSMSEEEAKEKVRATIDKLKACDWVKDMDTFIVTLYEFNKEYDLWINIKEQVVAFYTQDFENKRNEERKVWIEIWELYKERNKAKSSWNIERVEEIDVLLRERRARLKVLKEQIREAEVGKRSSEVMTQEDYTQIWEWEKTVDEALEEARERDEEFDKFYEDNKDYFKREDTNTNSYEHTQNTDTTTEKNTNQNTVYSFPVIPTSTWYIIPVSPWVDMEISPEEYNDLKDSPEKMMTLVDFYEELNKLWLEFVWQFRNFFTKVWDIWINIRNWITEVEIFKIYQIVWTQIWKRWNTITDARNDFRLIKRWVDIQCDIKWENLIPPESKTNWIYKWVIYAYLINKWYFKEWIIQLHKWNTDMS